MLSGLVRHLRLKAQAKTGLSPAVVIFAVVALICAVMTFLLLVFTAFVWLANRYSPLTAALILTGAFLLFTILAGIGAIMSRRSTVHQAEVALAARGGGMPFLDPKMLGVALQLGRNIGMRRI